MAAPLEVAMELEQKLEEEERKAWGALSRYKFLMFGYHSAVWVHLNSMLPAKRANPFRKLVDVAREEVK